MVDISVPTRAKPNILAAAVIVALSLIAVRVAGVAQAPIEVLVWSGYDEIMRLISVREWLNGAGWFDTNIDRVAPPEGLSLHWSRYVDAAIGGLILALSVFVPLDTAEAIAIIFWPTLLQVGFLALTAILARRLFGDLAAAFAVMAVVMWVGTAHARFGPVRIDHHGLQVLLTLVLIATLLLPMRARWAGVLGGLVAAFSLAIGLEMLLAIALAGVILTLRCVTHPVQSAPQLQAFGISLSLGAVLFFVGQTPSAEWFAARCDELAVPILVLAGAGGISALAIAQLSRRMQSPLHRGLMALALGIAALAAASPFLGPCVAGPYGYLPAELQRAISSHITEARPAHAYLRFWQAGNPIYYYIVPILAATVFATVIHLREGRSGVGAGIWAGPVPVLLSFAWLGLLGSGIQMRMAISADPVIPLLMGFVAAKLFTAWHARPVSAGRICALLLGFLSMFASGKAFELAYQWSRDPAPTTAAAPETVPFNFCRRTEVVQSLAALPPSRVMALGNLGLPVLLLTEHTIPLAPYHRSEMAMRNILLHHQPDPAFLFEQLAASQADYLVLCRNARYGDGTAYANELAAGASAEGLVPVSGMHPDLIVLRVVP